MRLPQINITGTMSTSSMPFYWRPRGVLTRHKVALRWGWGYIAAKWWLE